MQSNIAAPAEGRFSHKEMSMPKSSLSDMTTKRPKEPFDPALDAPIALTPDQLETVVGGFVSMMEGAGGGATTGAVPPPVKSASILSRF
jgi:hypothetical protein